VTIQQLHVSTSVVLNHPASFILRFMHANPPLVSVNCLTLNNQINTSLIRHTEGVVPTRLSFMAYGGLRMEFSGENYIQSLNIYEMSFWNPSNGYDGKELEIGRTAIVKDVGVPLRYPYEITIN